MGYTTAISRNAWKNGRARRASRGRPIPVRLKPLGYSQVVGEIENRTCLKNLAHFPPNVIFPPNSTSSPFPLPWNGQPLPALPLKVIPFEVTLPDIGPSKKAWSDHPASTPLSGFVILFPSWMNSKTIEPNPSALSETSPSQHSARGIGGAFESGVVASSALTAPGADHDPASVSASLLSCAYPRRAEPVVMPAISATAAADIVRNLRNPFIAKSSSKNDAVKFPWLGLAVTDRPAARAIDCISARVCQCHR